MPARTKVTKERIIEAAFEVARETGAEAINARTVSQKLGCSTQPVMYHFDTIRELKKAAYERADCFHTDYLMKSFRTPGDPLLEAGLNYIRFALKEPHLFRFLFQSGFAGEHDLAEMIDSAQLAPVLAAMQAAMGLPPGQAREIFVTLALFVHGYASLIVNNSLEYDETLIASQLKRVYTGAVLAVQEEAR